MLTEKQNTVFSNQLNKTFEWFRSSFVPKINETINEFWGENVSCRLIAAFDDENNLFKGEEFFVTKIFPPSTKKKNDSSTILVKLSKEAAKMFVENILGQNTKHRFQFEEMTELEVKILKEFNSAVGRNLFSICLNEGLQDHTNKIKYNLMFYIKNSKNETGKLCITMPASMIEPIEVTIHEFLFDLNKFFGSTTIVDILVGKSKTSLKDLKYLEKGDIVVLDNSKLNKMTLKINGEIKNIKVNPDPALIVKTENNEDNIMSTDITKDMWDTIQVEIGAEFEKVKITLGELKQISEGLVVDIGSVYENKIHLKVENKSIATGELVIINDRYGIRIDELHQNEEEPTPQAKSHRSEEEPEADYDINEDDISIEQEENGFDNEIDNDEFDYSDFDVDDEDI